MVSFFRFLKLSFLLLIPLTVCLLLTGFRLKNSASSNGDYKPLGVQLAQNAVDVSIKSKGGYSGECVVFDFKNRTSDSLFILLEPGRRLVARDSVFQDIFIVKEKKLVIPPSANLKTTGYGFCCQSHDSAPPTDAEFDAGIMAPRDWIRLAELINQNNYPVSVIQHAVWVISNDHPIGSINDKDRNRIMPLIKLVAEIKGVELPWYSVEYKKDTTLLFSGKPDKLYGQIKYFLSRNALVTIVIRNANGRLMKTLLKSNAQGVGNNYFDLEMDVSGWPNGQYQVFIVEDDSNQNSRLKFEL